MVFCFLEFLLELLRIAMEKKFLTQQVTTSRLKNIILKIISAWAILNMRKPNNVMMGSVICIISYLSVALMGVCVKSIPHSVGMGKIIFFQYAIALLLCLPLTIKNGLSSLKTKKVVGHLFRDISGIITFGLFFLSLLYISLTN